MGGIIYRFLTADATFPSLTTDAVECVCVVLVFKVSPSFERELLTLTAKLTCLSLSRGKATWRRVEEAKIHFWLGGETAYYEAYYETTSGEMRGESHYRENNSSWSVMSQRTHHFSIWGTEKTLLVSGLRDAEGAEWLLARGTTAAGNRFPGKERKHEPLTLSSRQQTALS